MWRFGWQACRHWSVNRRVDYQRLETSRLLDSRTCGWRGRRPTRANGPRSHRSKHQGTRWAVLWFSGLLKNTKGLPFILCILWISSDHGGCFHAPFIGTGETVRDSLVLPFCGMLSDPKRRKRDENRNINVLGKGETGGTSTDTQRSLPGTSQDKRRQAIQASIEEDSSTKRLSTLVNM